METQNEVTHIIVCKSDNIEYQKLILEFIESIGCEVKLNKQIVKEYSS